MAEAREPSRSRMVFLGDLEVQSIREACIGAAEFAATQCQLDFEPWPILSNEAEKPRMMDFRNADCVILNEHAHDWVLADAPSKPPPCAFVLGTRLHARACSVEIDERAVGAMAAGHLLDRGYRALACFVPAGATWAEHRAEGFARASAARGVKSRVHRLPAAILPIYWRSNLALRSQELGVIIKQLPRPCGVFAINDVIACFIIQEARHQGLRVPQEIGVIGVDNDPVPNAAAGMAISSVQLPFREVGRQAAAALNAFRQRKAPPKRITLQPVRVIVRTSTDAFMVQDSLLVRAQAFIEKNRHRPVRVSEVAKAAGTTGVTLGKQFRRHLQIRPSDYILLRRLEYAKELLRERRLNVQEISDHCGFHSCSYFCHVFKRVTGVTAGELHKLQVTLATNQPEL